MKYLEPKCKLCRRAGEKLLLKGERCASAKCAITKRNYPPGIHGVKLAGRKGGFKLSEYARQLKEKQKAKRVYGIPEKQIRIYYNKALKSNKSFTDVLLHFLEMRLDNVVYRAGFGSSRMQARQLVNHSHFMINGKTVNIPSYQVGIGDIITIKKSKNNNKFFTNFLQNLKNKKLDQLQSWFSVNKDTAEIKILTYPQADEVEKVFNPQLVLEFYSR